MANTTTANGLDGKLARITALEAKIARLEQEASDRLIERLAKLVGQNTAQ